MLSHIQQLTNDGQIKTLLSDTSIQELLSKGDTNALMANQDFQNLMSNADMQAILENADDGEMGKTSQQVAAEKMVAAWDRTEAIKNDPRVIAIISDPEFQQQLNSSNKFPLLTNPKLQMLTEIIFTAPAKTENGLTQYEIKDISNTDKKLQQPATKKNENTQEKTEQKIYRWTDESGKVHYSDSQQK